ncbi:MAG: GNAT family N-acetyltransferase [Bacteroidia bacterium]
MEQTNFERMIQLAEDVFATKDDPDQLDVNEQVIERLLMIHPNSVSEYDDGNGPVAWLILIPSTKELMNQFFNKEISEKVLFLKTKIGEKYDSVYLCSGLVLPEYRRKGITKELAKKALAEIRKQHEIKSLVAWPFTKEGNLASEDLARYLGLPLLLRQS